MTFAKTPGEDPTQGTGQAAAEELGEAAAKVAGEKINKVVGIGEKVLEAGAVIKSVGEGGVKAIGDKVMTAVTAKAATAIGDKITGIAGGGLPGIGVGIAGGSLGHIAGGQTPGIVAGQVPGIAGGQLPGMVGSPDLPFFEDKAITSFTGTNPGGTLPGKAGGLLGKAVGAIASQLGGKNLEVEIASGDALDVRNFSVQERVSALFQVNLVVVSDNPGIEFDAVVGQPARFVVHAGTHERFWSGLCSHFEQVRVEPGGLSTYQLTIVPPLWLLTQRKNYRMFQQISEPDIVLKVLKEWDIEPEVRIDRAAYKKRKYRVQYAESDFAFISRMLEDAGIAYYFEQVGAETKLVLSDAPHANPKRAHPVAFMDDTSAVRKLDMEFATGVRMGQRVRPGKYTLRDHDYRRPPSYKLMSSASGGQGVEDKLERYHYTPGAFLFGTDQGDASVVADDRGKTRTDEKEAAILAQKRLDAKRGSARVCTFETNAHDLAPGVVMSMAGHPHGALSDSRTLLIVESSLNGTALGEWSHHCEARGTEVPFRPEMVTPKPKVNGVESATVVGPAGEEIHTDEFGRVRVHFHWDRESKMNERSSCWIHVSQPWGGAGFGGSNLPRIGQEVIVDFLGGDPDRPVIVGRLYTNLQKTPYKLPDNKTQSGWQSRSSPGGGGDNYNEMMFEDKKGQELVRMQAEKDLNKLVKHDEQVKIGNDRTKQVVHDDALTVGNDRTRMVGHDESVSIGNDRTRMVGNNESVTIGNSRSKSIGVNESLFVGADQSEQIGANRTEQVGANHSETIGANMSLSVGMAKTETVVLASAETVGAAKALTVGGAYAVTVGGMMATTVALVQTENVGISKTVNVGSKIEIVCGSSSIVLEKSGKIAITGTEITVNGTQIVIAASGPAELHGATVKITGDPIDLN